MSTSISNRVLIAVFLGLLTGMPLAQVIIEVSRGEWPRVLDVFRHRPTVTELRAYEHALEEASVAGRWLRTGWRAVEFRVRCDGGEAACIGRDGWLFYQPGVAALTQRPRRRDATVREAVAAIVDLQRQLDDRGIRLLVLPVPNKESVYPDRLSRGAKPPVAINGSETRALLAQCAQAGVEVVDLFAVFRQARHDTPETLYLAQDSHWSPVGMQKAAAAVAERIVAQGWMATGDTRYDTRPVSVQHAGDLVRMFQSPFLEALFPPERITCERVVRRVDGAPYADDPTSDILVLGDSFLRIYEQDDPGQAGFTAHLARWLGRPLASIVNDGGGSTLVRQQLARHPERLAGKRVVVWEFVERDIRLGTEGWPCVHQPGERSVPAFGQPLPASTVPPVP